MLENFRAYLIQQGYSQETPSGNRSTVDDYPRRVGRIAERESISIDALSTEIDEFVIRYDTFGAESEYGARSNGAYINALKRFQEFVNRRQ